MIYRRLLVAVALTLGPIGAFDASAKTLVLGSVSDKIKKHLARFQPLAQEGSVEATINSIFDPPDQLEAQGVL